MFGLVSGDYAAFGDVAFMCMKAVEQHVVRKYLDVMFHKYIKLQY